MARPFKLDPYEEYVRDRLEDFDLPAPTLLRELKSRGYDVGLTILRQFVRPLKAKWIRRVTEHFETLPGRQAQFDWGESGPVMQDGQRRK